MFISHETKSVWVAWSNSDLTEGRGWRFPLHVAESYETAKRLGRKGGIMGTDCEVTEELAVKHNGMWLVPGKIAEETTDDTSARIRREQKEAAIKKALSNGLTDEDIKVLGFTSY